VSDPFFPLASSTWSDEEYSAIERVIQSRRFTMGEEVRNYESEFATQIGSRYGVMSNSGSSANLLAIAGLKYMKNSPFKDGDEIIVPAVSWSTTFYPVHQLGFQLSFIDIDLETLNIDPQKVLDAISPRTRAIFAVNLLGNPSNLIELSKIAEDNDLVLLEDNCESLGASIEGKSAGTFGMAGTFSSFFSHHISTMEGGITLTDDLYLYETMISLRAHGWTRELPITNSVHNKSGDIWDDFYRFVLPGYNLRPLEIEAAIGREQIKKLNQFVINRRENHKILLSASSRFSNIKLQRENGNSSWFGFSLLLTGPLEGKRGALIAKLDEAGIQSRPIVAGNFARNPVMKHLRHTAIPQLPNADAIHSNGLFVGNHHFDLSVQLGKLVHLLEEFEDKNG
jgi:CDP-6-deoxy-D-xylo-4-hexulose-3-dehydrase